MHQYDYICIKLTNFLKIKIFRLFKKNKLKTCKCMNLNNAHQKPKKLLIAPGQSCTKN